MKMTDEELRKVDGAIMKSLLKHRWGMDLLKNSTAIESIEDKSDCNIRILHIKYTNGYELIIQGEGTYGEEFGLFEIALLDKKEGMFVSHKIRDGWEEDVIGNVPVEELLGYIIKGSLLS